VKRLVRRLTDDGGEVRACYEAGPTGYELQRTLERGGIVCDVVAPALVPQKAGDRVKTDRRDALNLARLLRAGMLTEVRPPTSAEEAVRDLCRTRYTVTRDLSRCRNRLKMFLLRRNRVAPGPNHWTRGHHGWLRTQTFNEVADNYAFEDLYRGVLQPEDRRKALDQRLTELAEQEPYRAPVAHLRCFRGIDTVVAMTVVTELHGFERFRSPPVSA
jgi:transposase